MKTNFILYQNYAIKLDNKHFDLHNNFDFIGFDFDKKTKTLKLNWVSNKGNWVPIDNPLKLSITIYDVEYLLIIPKKELGLSTDNSCLSDLTYYPSDEREENECLTQQELPLPSDDIIFNFESGQTIRANGKVITAEYE